MVNVIDMQGMRQLNLFEKITRIRTRFCFKYNEAIFFCVPRALVQRAVGEKGNNVRRLSEILKKRIKIVPLPNGIQHLKQFIQAIVNPVTFKDIEINEYEIILTAGNQSKAALLGRNKRRLIEMQKIIKDFFSKDFRIV